MALVRQIYDEIETDKSGRYVSDSEVVCLQEGWLNPHCYSSSGLLKKWRVYHSCGGGGIH